MHLAPVMHFVETLPAPLPQIGMFSDAEELQLSDDHMPTRSVTGQYVAMGGAMLLTAMLLARGLR